MSAISKRRIHEHIVRALGKDALSEGPLEAVPLLLKIEGPGLLAVFAFTLTAPIGGRPVTEHKIQLIAPGQSRTERGCFRAPNPAFRILLGWSCPEDVFVLWDAYAHDSFAYSQNLQVKGEILWHARARGISLANRALRGRPDEIVIACRQDYLLEGIRTRVRQTANRLVTGGQI